MKNFKLLQKVEYWKCYLLTAVFFIATIPVHAKSVPSFNENSIKVHENEIYVEKLGRRQALIVASEQGFSNNAIHSIAKVESLIQEFLSKEQVDVTLASIFSASDALDKNSKTQKISTFLDSYRNFSIDKIQIQVRKSEELLGAWAVFAAKGHQGKPVIYLNEKSSQYLTEDQLVRVLLEEMGHWIDFQIHGNLDSPGDEGQLFAAIVQKGSVSEDFKNRLLEETLKLD